MRFEIAASSSWLSTGDPTPHEREKMAHMTKGNRYQRRFAARIWTSAVGLFVVFGCWGPASQAGNVTGHGCFANVHKQAFGPGIGLLNWRKHVRLMKAHGMNTFVLYINSPEDLAAQIDIAIEEEMLESSIPIFVIVQSPNGVHERIVPNWEEVVKADTNPIWAPGQFTGHVAVLKKSRRSQSTRVNGLSLSPTTSTNREEEKLART